MIPTINVNWNGKNCVEKWKLYMSFDIWLRRETKLATRICALEIQLNEHTYNYAPPSAPNDFKEGRREYYIHPQLHNVPIYGKFITMTLSWVIWRKYFVYIG